MSKRLVHGGNRHRNMQGSRAGHASMQSVSTGNGLQGARSEHSQSSWYEDSSQQHAHTCLGGLRKPELLKGATAVVDGRRAERLEAAQRRWTRVADLSPWEGMGPLIGCHRGAGEPGQTA